MNPPNRTSDVAPLFEPLEPRLLLDAGATFDTSHHFFAGGLPWRVVAADLNADIILDLAATLPNRNEVAVLYGKSGGGFDFPVPFGVGSTNLSAFRQAIVAGDFDKNGRVDLAVTNSADDDVTVLYGQTAGGFSRTDYPVGDDPVDIAVADFDKNGWLDMAVTNEGSDDVTVLYGRSTGGFSRQDYTVVDNSESPCPQTIVAGDFNGDGWLDLLVGTPQSLMNFAMLYGDGSGSFGGPEIVYVHQYAALYSVAAEDSDRDGLFLSPDFDKNGMPDLAFAVPTLSNDVGVSLAQATGGFDSVHYYQFGDPDECWDIISDDFDRDGNLDLAVTNRADDTIELLFGEGDGSFSFGAYKKIPVGDQPIGIASGDLDGDGFPDLVAANYSSRTVTVVYNQQGDVTGPTADLTDPENGKVINLGELNERYYIDVTFSDTGGSGLNALTIVDAAAEFSLGGAAAAGVILSAVAPTLVPGTTSTYRYAFTGSFAAGPVSVNFLADTWRDVAENPNTAEAESFTVTDGQASINLSIEVRFQNELKTLLWQEEEITAETVVDAVLDLVEQNYADPGLLASYSVSRNGSITYFNGIPASADIFSMAGPASSVCRVWFYCDSSLNGSEGSYEYVHGNRTIRIGLPGNFLDTGDIDEEYIADVLTHELAHLQGTLDLYCIEVDPDEAIQAGAGVDSAIVGLTYDYPNPPSQSWLMEGGDLTPQEDVDSEYYNDWDPFTLGVLNRNTDFLSTASYNQFDARDQDYTLANAAAWSPTQVRLRLVDSGGSPVSGKTVKVYQKQYHDFDSNPGSRMDGVADFTGTTDANGYYVFPAASTLFANENFVILVTAEGMQSFFTDITEWNKAYWSGQTAGFDIVRTAGPPAAGPEVDVTDDSGNATDKAVTLPDTQVGQTSTAKVFTLSNSGDLTLSVTNFQKGGTDSGQFGVTVKTNTGGVVSGSSFSIPAGTSYTVDVTFSPSAPIGGKSGNITFNTNDPDDNEGFITLTMSGQGLAAAPPRVTSVVLNGREDRGVSDIEPSGIGVRTIDVTFTEAVNLAADDVTVQTVTFPGGVEAISETLTPMVEQPAPDAARIILGDAVGAVDTWVKVTLSGTGTITDAAGNALDGDPPAHGSGRGYIYDADEDLPSGDGTAGGDAVFYVGSLRGDMRGYGPGEEEPDGEITPWDITGFTQKYLSDDLDADMAGYGPGQAEPDADVNPWDISGFTSRYSAAMAAGTHLDLLPTAGEAAMAAGAPAPLPLLAAESVLALTDAPEVALLARTDEPDASDTQPAEQPTTVLPALATVSAASGAAPVDGFALALVAGSANSAVLTAWPPPALRPVAEADRAAAGDLLDPLALPALDVRL